MTISPDTTTGTAPAVAIPAPRTAAEDIETPAVRTASGADGPPVPAVPAPAVAPCRCGHEQDAHEHYRPGTDCGACGSGCRSFRARTGRGARSSATGTARPRPRLFSGLLRRR